MAPLVAAFDPARLEKHVQIKPDGKAQKPPIDLKKCELRELIQYECDLIGPREDKRSKVICEPVLRLFRRCADGLTVETTAWEGIYDQAKTGGD